MRYLAIGPHCDDVELGCGATLAKRADEGHQIYILHLSKGPVSRGTAVYADHALWANALEAQAHRAGEIIGAAGVQVHNLPDNQFDSQPLLYLAQTIEAHINLIKPDVVFGPWHGDLNQDHEMVARAIAIATRPTTDNWPVSQVYAYEVLSSTEWTMLEPFKPNVYVNVSDTMVRKLDAFRQYDSEVGVEGHPRSLKVIRALATLRGSQAGLLNSEGFKLLRSIE